LWFFVLLSPEGIMFWGCPSVRCLLICPDKYCYHDISWTSWAIWIKLTGNIH